MRAHVGRRVLVASVASLTVAFLAAPPARALSGGVPGTPGAEVSGEQHRDRSRPLREIPPAPRPPADQKAENRVKRLPGPFGGLFDPVVQTRTPAGSAPTIGTGLEGIGQGFTGVGGTFTVNSAPPDTNAAVGPNHIVEVVNSALAVFDKAGTSLYGPVPTNTLWSGFGGGCAANNDGDATVEYDRLADRWIVSQFSVTTTPYLQCVAVSRTPDPTGTYNRYAFSYGSVDFPDYPKLGVWPDGYYTTFNIFAGGARFSGPKACAYDRASMLAGLAATQQCFQLGTAYAGLLPSDLDGNTAPPAGAPAYLMDFGTNALELWKFHVDWATPANSTLSGPPAQIPAASFTPACNGGTCIHQPGTSQQLDSLGDRLMYRLAYRNLGDHEALVVNQSVNAGATTGVRWYEVRSPSANPAIFQQGTYAPGDGVSRWMGSAAMDQNGNIGLGFSASSSGVFPGLRFTGRLAGDPLNTMTQGETTLIAGGGSQNGGLARWGDYSSLAIDPVDDCTFWFASEYLAATGSFNWHTRLGSFRLPGCNTPPPEPDYSLSATPASQSVVQGATASTTVNVTPLNAFTGAVTFSADGAPAGTTPTFSPNPATDSTTMTIPTTGSTPVGSSTITITGTSGTLVRTTTVTLDVTSATPPPPPDFSLAVSPTSRNIPRGANTTYGVTVTRLNGYTGTVSLTLSGLPNRTSASFSPNPTGSTSTLSVKTDRKAPTGSFQLKVTGTGAGTTHAQTVTLSIR